MEHFKSFQTLNLKELAGYVATLTVIAASFLAGCTEDKEPCAYVPDIASIDLALEFEQFEDSVTAFTSKQQLVNFLTLNPIMRDYFFRRRDYPDDSVFINQLYKRFNHLAFDTLFAETKRIFGDGAALKEQFREAFTNVKFYYPAFEPPKIQTVISGLDNDLFVSDTLVIVGLDYYLGKSGKYRPQIYDYLLARYEPEDIVPSVLLLNGISDRFNKINPEDKTVLADMIAYGKAFYFAKHMLPCLPDSTLIWYTSEEIEGAEKHQDLIWYRLIEDEVLYSTIHTTRQKFLGDRPKTLEVGEKCPGRIGQWIGWQIINKYMETHPATTLTELMETADAQLLFKESRYKPEGK